jgi:hypothetical protein
MPDDAGSPAGTGAADSGTTEPNPTQQTPSAPPGTPAPPAATSNELTAAQAEAATWRGRYRTLQDKFDNAVTEARKSGDDERDVLRERLVRAEVRAVAAGRLADPADAIKFLDLSSFVAKSGEIDGAAIAKAVDELLVGKPYLAAASSSAPANGHGSADQGPRGGSKPPATVGDVMNAVIRGAPSKH